MTCDSVVWAIKTKREQFKRGQSPMSADGRTAEWWDKMTAVAVAPILTLPRDVTHPNLLLRQSDSTPRTTSSPKQHCMDHGGEGEPIPHHWPSHSSIIIYLRLDLEDEIFFCDKKTFILSRCLIIIFWHRLIQSIYVIVCEIIYIIIFTTTILLCN